MKYSSSGLLVRDAPPLSELTGIRLGGKPVAEIVLRDDAEAEKLFDLAAGLGGRPAVIGRGSNIIAADEDLPLVLIRQETREKATFARHGAEILAKARAGLPLPALLNAAAAAGLGGLEGLAGIPGGVGGAVAMNAGSFGTEIGALVRSLTIVSPRFGLRELRVEPSGPGPERSLERSRESAGGQPPQAGGSGEAAFSYRNALCLGRPLGSKTPDVADEAPLLLLEAVFALYESDADTVRARMRAVLAEKRLRQPVDAACAGCVFKNPAPDAPAGRLLEEAGMKGKALGGMRFSPLHAGFLVNEGGGSCAAALELMDMAVETVKRRSGFTLEKEVCLWVRQ